MAAAILITGANRGLGFEFASQYLAEGWRVFAACRNPDAASATRNMAGTAGRRSENSQARIVQKYFYAWAQVIMPAAERNGKRIAYIDLYAGPGAYPHATKATASAKGR